jgi:hypothetical protein
MPLTYKEFYLELTNSIPRLPVTLAKRLVNRAWRDIQDSRQWSFLKGEGHLYSPAIVTSGTFDCLKFNSTVTANPTAIAAISGMSNPDATLRQIRFGTGPNSVYNIQALDPDFTNNGVLYLDRPYLETTNPTATYKVYRCYYGPPLVLTYDSQNNSTLAEVTDFLRYNDIYNPVNSRWFVLPVKQREELDNRDPQRAVFGIPYSLYAYKYVNNVPYFEMWPHPRDAVAYICSYQRRATEFSSDASTLPIPIPDELLMERSLFYGCEWASKNQTRYAELKGINWRLEQAAHKITYSNISKPEPRLIRNSTT